MTVVDNMADSNRDERTPLLVNGVANGNAAAAATAADTAGAAEPAAVVDRRHADDNEKPLPMRQILLICYARLVEPIAFFGIFPFVNQMVQRNGGLPESEVGFYSGLIESLFSLTQMVVMMFWGRLSDRVGRKPVLVFSMAGVTVMTAAFGFAATIWQMILLRCIGGVFSGSVVTLRVMMTEHSTPKTQARAFSLFNVSNNIGIFVGPLVGGSLADPAGQYGGVFKKVAFFVKFPYALPTLTTAFIGLTATIVAALFIEETLPAKKPAGQDSSSSRYEDNKSFTIWQLLRQPGVFLVFCLYSHVLLMAYSYTAVIPVFWFTSVGRGGFGWTPYQISLFIALAGVSQALWTLFAFAPLQKRHGTGWIFRLCSWLYIPFYAGSPLLNLLLRHSEAHNGVQWEVTLFWVIAAVVYSVGPIVSMNFTAMQLALNDISPSPAAMSTLNALAMTAASGFRSVTPASSTALFALGVDQQILKGYLIWLVFFILIGVLMALSYNIPAKAEGIVKEDESGPA